MQVRLTRGDIASLLADPHPSAAHCKVYSLDCWGTIIDARKEIWNDISDIFRTVFMLDKSTYTVTEISITSKRVNDELDIKTSLDGIEFTQVMRIAAVCEALGIYPNEQLIHQFVIALDNYLSETGDEVRLVEQDIRESISKAKKEGAYIVLLSNSGYISGSQTRILLRKHKLLELFDEVYFSDEIGHSKPSPKIYRHLVNRLVNDGRIDEASEVLHIGDNRNLDYLAALYCGLSAVHISKEWHSWEGVDSVEEYRAAADGRILYGGAYSPQQYSRFKFGVTRDIERAAEIMYAKLLDNVGEIITASASPMFAEVYNYIPSASTLLVRLVKDKIDNHRRSLSLPPCRVLWIKRTRDSLGSYSHIHATKRSGSLFDDFKIITPYPAGVDTPVLVLDDMFVSGVFTSKVKHVIKSAGFSKVHFMYLAQCHEDTLHADIAVEHMINSSAVANLNDLKSYVAEDAIMPTRKYYKLLLSSDNDDIEEHLAVASISLKRNIINDLSAILEDLPAEKANVARRIQDHLAVTRV